MDAAGVRLYSAAIAYRTVSSFIAFMTTIAVVLILAGVEPGSLRDHVTTISSAGSSDSSNDLEQIAYERAARTLELGESTAWIAGIVGVGVGLYTLSAGFAALCEVLDRIHGTHVYRRMSRRYIRGLGVSLLFLVLAIVTAVALLITTALGTTVFGGLGLQRLSTAWEFLFRFVIPACSVLATFVFLLRYGSHARPQWGQVLPGAAVATTAWLLLLSGFTAYVAWFNGFEYYGALASVFALLLFGYLQAWILILVALFHSEVAYVFALLPGVHRTSSGGVAFSSESPGGPNA
jgi:membrane protein